MARSKSTNGLINELSKKKIEEFKKENADKPYAKEIKRKSKEYGGLVPYSKLSKEAREYNARLGSIASREKRRNTLILSETMKMLLEMPLVDEDIIRTTLQSRGYDDELLTEATAICFSQIQRAKQDSKSFEVVRDTIGQKPIDKQVVVTSEETPQEIISKHFGSKE